ncbi:translation initiation factor IF-3, mitochondrial [Topomyia yanbarensis]|uniref:translation initiation factor IF-3, mitochondrial n=1 Tax=Topomyia yanbarensis TaxID=2498891 RepID=UPI00273C2933|nr:translation initiation factor IF-3, mitochondrial [Topomyia yanbarensis]
MNILGQAVRSAIRIRPAIGVSIRSCSAAVVLNPVAAVAATNFSRYSTNSARPSPPGSSDGGATGTKKPKTSPKITLVGTDDSVTIVSMDEAQKISKRRDLKLVRIIDVEVKTQRPVYRLMTSAEYLTEDLKRRQEKKLNREQMTIKGDKLLSISARITSHDLESKIHNVLKWLRKSYEVRVVIAGDGDKSKQEAVAARFQEATKDVGKILQHRFKENNLRFNIMPVTSTSGNVENSSEVPSKSVKKDLLDGKQNGGVSDKQPVRAIHNFARMQA